MATHSSILVQRIPWIEEPGGLQFMGLQSLQLTLSFSPFPEPQHTLYISPSHVPTLQEQEPGGKIKLTASQWLQKN